MKPNLKTIAAIAIGAYTCSFALADDKDHEHKHDHDHDHEHDELVAGPNGGRVFQSVEPHLEFLVTEDRKIRITALKPDNKTVIPIGDQRIRVIGGDRTKPTRLAFTRERDSLLSDGTLPEGNDFPIVVQISAGEGKPVMEKFNLNLNDCPTCDYKEYACACEHGEHEECDHDDHGGKKEN